MAAQEKPSGLLEREGPLDQLRNALADAGNGAGRIAFVSGEAGIGKTSLVRAFLALLPHRSARVLSGACDNFVTPRTMGPFRDLAHAAGPDLRTALAAGCTDAVLDQLLEEISTPSTVIVVEDVHWADEATLDALAFLARRVEHHPSLIIATYRDDEVRPESPLRRLLAAVRAPTAVRVGLAPLSARAVSALAGDHGTGLRLHASTRGNPFFVTELLAAQDEGVPASVRDAVLARVATLEPQARDLLDLLSVVPTRLETGLLDALHPRWAEDAAAAERRGIIEVRDGALAFRHELARLAVANALPAGRRHVLGRSVLSVLLEQDPRDEARILHHAVLCGDADAIAANGPAAARSASRAGAHQQALSHYEQMQPYIDRLPAAERAAVTEGYAWELYNALRFGEAVDHSRAAVAQRAALGDALLHGRAMVALAWHLYLDADVAEAQSVVDEAVAALEPTGDPRALALAHSYRGALRILGDREEEGLAELDAAARLGESSLEAVGTSYRGLGLAFLGDDAGLAVLRRGVADAVGQGRREFAALGYTALVKAARRLGRDADVRRSAEDGLARTRETDLRSHGFTLEAHLYQMLAQEGRWDEAEAGLRHLLDIAPDAGILGRETLPHLGRLLMRRGHPDADALLERAWALAVKTDILPVLVPAGLALIERAWLAGDPEPQRHRAELLVARTDRPGVARYRGEILRYAARCGWSLGEPAGCRPEHLLGLRGDWEGAAQEWQRIGDPYERALELAESGLPEPTLEALDVLDGLGAAPAARLVRARLRELGVAKVPRGPRPATRAHPAGLTERQGDVLRMLGDGLTNAEIAAKLVVSVRTVDHHVSAILMKLGVSGRRDAARIARELV
jgi:DNA-binding CsgD family transcriptional regulator/tetratricopeptide (TPR) repeat protein